MAQAGIGWAQPDIEQQQIDRQRALAMQLRQQAQSPVQGQMAGGMYVAPHWTQQLAKALSPLAADMADKRTDQKAQAYAEKLRTDAMRDVEGFTGAMQGAPARTIQPLTPNDDEGNAMAPVDVAAQGPDRMKALAIAMSSRNPMLQQAGGSILSSIMPKVPKYGVVERFNEKTGAKEKVIIDENNPTAPAMPFGGTEAVKGISVNGQIVDPTKIGTTVAPQLAADSIVTRDANGNLVANQPVLSAKTQIAAAGKPQISVDARNFNTQESEQSKAYGKTLGEMRGTIMQAGFDAPKKIAQLDRMEQLLGGVGGGKLEPTLADLTSYANSMGVKLDPKLGVKEASAALAGEMAASMRQPGTGPMTDKDFDNFLKRVPDLSKSPEGRAEITKTMRAALERDQRAAKFASEYARKNGGVIDDGFMDAMSDFYAKNPVVTPKMPATNARGQPFTDPGKEDRYQAWKRSQGMK